MTKCKFITITVDNSKINGWRLEGKVRTDCRNYKDVEMFEKEIICDFFFYSACKYYIFIFIIIIILK